VMTKDFLKANGIAYSEIDVSANEKAADEMIEKSGQMGVPVIDVDGQIIVGFNKPALKKALGLALKKTKKQIKKNKSKN